MKSIAITEVRADQSPLVASLVDALLLELDPGHDSESSRQSMIEMTRDLLQKQKIIAFIAMHGKEAVGLLTLHECAAIYAGGLFGEISELYVRPEARSKNVGKLLINAAIEKAKEKNWKRLEVGSPAENEWPRTIEFYENNGFKAIGKRLGLKVGLENH